MNVLEDLTKRFRPVVDSNPERFAAILVAMRDLGGYATVTRLAEKLDGLSSAGGGFDPTVMVDLASAGYLDGHRGMGVREVTYALTAKAWLLLEEYVQPPAIIDAATYLTLSSSQGEDARIRAAHYARRVAQQAGRLYAADVIDRVKKRYDQAGDLRFRTYPGPDGTIYGSVTKVLDADSRRVLWSEDLDPDDVPSWTDEEQAAWEALADLQDDSTVCDRLAQLAALDGDFFGEEKRILFSDYLS